MVCNLEIFIGVNATKVKSYPFCDIPLTGVSKGGRDGRGEREGRRKKGEGELKMTTVLLLRTGPAIHCAHNSHTHT